VKKNVLTYVLFIALAIAGCLNLHAQTCTATASKTTVSVGEEFEVDFTVDGNASAFIAPSFSDFQNLSGRPMQSTSFQSGTGIKSSLTTTFSYDLQATKEGTFTINPANVRVGNKTVTSNSLTIKVVKGTPQQSADAAAKSNILLRSVPEKTKVYIGEAIPVTLKVYTRVQLENVDINPPNYTGFFCENVPQKGQPQGTQTNINGTNYIAINIKQSVIYPQRAGKLEIDAGSAECSAIEQVKANPHDFFASLMPSYKRVPYTVKSDPVSIEVMPLPHTDKDFSGAVGRYTLKSSLDKNSVKANDAVNLTVTISGDGELKLIDSIPFKFPTDFDHYDPKINDHITVSPSGVSGSRTFTYVLIPRHQGKYKIPATGFTYFDPAKKSYVTLDIPEMPLDVAKGDNNNATVTVSGATINKEDVKLLGSDIRYIHTGHMPAYHTDDYFLYSFPFYAGILSPLFCFVGFVFMRRKYIELNKDATSVKRRGATRMAKKRLKAANGFIASGNKEKFYEELHKAMNGYLGDKFTIPVADMSRETINQKLTDLKASPDSLQKLSTVLDNCEFARYAPASVTGNLGEVYESAVQLITQLEDEIAG